MTVADTPSLEVESSPAVPHVVKHVQRIMSHTARVGFYFLMRNVECRMGNQIPPVGGVFLFWANFSSGVNLNSWRAMICLQLRLNPSRVL